MIITCGYNLKKKRKKCNKGLNNLKKKLFCLPVNEHTCEMACVKCTGHGKKKKKKKKKKNDPPP